MNNPKKTKLLYLIIIMALALGLLGLTVGLRAKDNGSAKPDEAPEQTEALPAAGSPADADNGQQQSLPGSADSTEAEPEATAFPALSAEDRLQDTEGNTLEVTAANGREYEISIYIIRTFGDDVHARLSGDRLEFNGLNSKGAIEYKDGSFTLCFDLSSDAMAGESYPGFYKQPAALISNSDLIGRWECDSYAGLYVQVEAYDGSTMGGYVHSDAGDIPFSGVYSHDTGLSLTYAQGEYNIEFYLSPHTFNGDLDKLYVYYSVYNAAEECIFCTTGDTALYKEG